MALPYTDFDMGHVWPALSQAERTQMVSLAYTLTTPYGIDAEDKLPKKAQQGAFLMLVRHLVDNQINDADNFAIPPELLAVITDQTRKPNSFAPTKLTYEGETDAGTDSN